MSLLAYDFRKLVSVFVFSAALAACGGPEEESTPQNTTEQTAGANESDVVESIAQAQHSSSLKCKSPRLAGAKCKKINTAICVKLPTNTSSRDDAGDVSLSVYLQKLQEDVDRLKKLPLAQQTDLPKEQREIAKQRSAALTRLAEFQIGAAQNFAWVVSSAVRVVLESCPRLLTSLSAAAYASLDSAGGGSGRN